MSRGLGDMQNAILHLLNAAEGDEEVTVEKMRWSLYEAAGKRPVGERLDNSWNTSVSRAAKGLEDRELVVISRRRLEGFDECVRHYPGKALQARKRELRIRFLPMILKGIRRSGGIFPRYSQADNEKFHLEQLAHEELEDLTWRWSQIESALRPIYGQALLEFADEILCLICKGRRLFRCRGIQLDTPQIEVSTSLASAIESVCDRNLLPSRLMTELRAFNGKFLSKHAADTLKLKSFIHSIAEVPRHGQCALKPATLKYLHENDKDFVENMSGYEEKSRPTFLRGGRPEFGDSHFFKYSPDLTNLFDHTVFQEFNFIKLAA